MINLSFGFGSVGRLASKFRSAKSKARSAKSLPLAVNKTWRKLANGFFFGITGVLNFRISHRRLHRNGAVKHDIFMAAALTSNNKN